MRFQTSTTPLSFCLYIIAQSGMRYKCRVLLAAKPEAEQDKASIYLQFLQNIYTNM
ncbi:hypothetical protein [Lancefieldella sp. Marseille-Q7238]|uniref:hypothetical protein n=1 Tax=Lancefieldella sp. Marseille-Q7238 TaxID=3022127 RepID=UPI0024A7AB3C|nr:hypothetical protein [Lancefieldella sp. Marseille-Q7238]